MHNPTWLKVWTVAATGCAMLLASAAWAQDDGGVPKAKSRAPRGVITLAEVTITGRIQKPIAAVDVARIRPKLTLSELRQPFVARITDAIYKDPF
ncbi:MAG: hypothetical protein JRI68_29345 [Deltaproteobacteria bacterium]|nr:hypothetical protein [Deltaproteobacteria bacterium]